MSIKNILPMHTKTNLLVDIAKPEVQFKYNLLQYKLVTIYF